MVKTDGKTLFTVAGDTIYAISVSGASVAGLISV